MYRRTIATLAWLVWFMMLRSEAPAAAPGREVDPVAAVGLTVVRGLRLLDTPCAFGHVLELNQVRRLERCNCRGVHPLPPSRYRYLIDSQNTPKAALMRGCHVLSV